QLRPEVHVQHVGRLPRLPEHLGADDLADAQLDLEEVVEGDGVHQGVLQVTLPEASSTSMCASPAWSTRRRMRSRPCGSASRISASSLWFWIAMRRCTTLLAAITSRSAGGRELICRPASASPSVLTRVTRPSAS